MASETKNMTSGSPARLILAFALPLMVGNIFQQLYTVVDTIVVGNALGIDALAAVGNGEWLNWLVLSMIQGFAQGFCIQLAQDFGAGDYKQLRRTYSTSVYLSAICAVVILVLSLSLMFPVLRLMNTPDSIIGTSASYLGVIFAGAPIVMAYNLFAAVLRALGDSKTPLRAMIIASLTNVVLDLLFVMVFHWGVAGAALATVIGQALSALICFRAIRGIDLLRMEKGEMRFDRMLAARLMRLATPFAFQNFIISVGGLVVQFVINGFGVLYIAGFTATNKLYGILEIAAYSYGFAMTTYAGQNLGAGKIDRIGKGTRAGAWMGMATAAVIGIAMLIFGRVILGCFVSGNESDVAATIEIAYRYLSIMAVFLPVLYLLYVFRSALQGIGDTVMPMVSGVAELVMRIGVILILPHLIGEDGLFWAEISAWLGADVVLISSYCVRMRRLKKELHYDR